MSKQIKEYIHSGIILGALSANLYFGYGIVELLMQKDKSRITRDVIIQKPIIQPTAIENIIDASIKPLVIPLKESLNLVAEKNQLNIIPEQENIFIDNLVVTKTAPEQAEKSDTKRFDPEKLTRVESFRVAEILSDYKKRTPQHFNWYTNSDRRELISQSAPIYKSPINNISLSKGAYHDKIVGQTEPKILEGIIDALDIIKKEKPHLLTKLNKLHVFNTHRDYVKSIIQFYNHNGLEHDRRENDEIENSNGLHLSGYDHIWISPDSYHDNHESSLRVTLHEFGHLAANGENTESNSDRFARNLMEKYNFQVPERMFD